MKRLVTVCIVLAQVAGMASDKTNAELLCVWNYKTQFQNISREKASTDVTFTEVNVYYFFSDNTFVKTDYNTTYMDVLKMKAVSCKRWMTVDNNLILLDQNGKQETGFVSFENQPVQNLLKGEKEINQVVTLKSGAVPSSYNDVLAFSPQ